MSRLKRLAVVVSTAVLSVPVHAQETAPVERRLEELERRYEARLAALENEVSTLREALRASGDAGAASARDEVDVAVDRLLAGGAMTRPSTLAGRFDDRWNPAVGVVADFVLAVSDRDDSFDEHNRFFHRGVEISFAGRIDPYAAYFATLNVNADEVELEEAYVDLDRALPDVFRLKAGRFFRDVGKLGPLHDHELPFTDKPAVYQDYLGGSPSGLGVELHHWFGVGEVPVRWSLGVIDDPEADSHAVAGPAADAGHAHDDEGPDGVGRRGLENFAWHARVAASLDLGETHVLQLGASALFAPERVGFADDGVGGVLRFETRKNLFSADATWRWRDPSREDALTAGVEAFLNRERFASVDASATPFTAATTGTVSAFGLHAWAEYAFDRRWSAGGFFDRLERAADDGFLWTGGGAFVSFKLSEMNRLRLQIQAIDDELRGDAYWVGMIQWTTVLGSHGHPLEW
ncbi:MAG TPA: hypothetical protein VEI02_01085 [Planctomycetota bacterium]|nr:hypothetical protein [Planctomycetota bacterium]